MSWWVQSLLGSTSELSKENMSKLPSRLVELLREKGAAMNISGSNGTLSQELMDLIRTHLDTNKDTLPMSIEEAKEHRLKLMQERSAHKVTAEGWWQKYSYCFCEH
jgi:hypothetical protein